MQFDKIQSLEKFNLKKLTSEDIVKYKNIRLNGLKTDPRTFGATFEKEAQKDEEYWKGRLLKNNSSVYAIDNGNIFISTAASKKLTNETMGIFGVYTMPEFRGKNLSTQLINHILEEAKQSGVKVVSLHVNTNNENAIHVYEKLGFKIIKTDKDIKMGDGNMHDLYFMEKNLIQV